MNAALALIGLTVAALVAAVIFGRRAAKTEARAAALEETADAYAERAKIDASISAAADADLDRELLKRSKPN